MWARDELKKSVMASTAKSGAGTVTPGCATCGRVLPREAYTNRQWKGKSKGTGRCKECVAASDPTAAGKAKKAGKRKATAPPEVRPEFAVSPAELAACCDVLRRFHQRSEIFMTKPYRALRTALQPLIAYQSETQYGSVSRDEYNASKRRKLDEQRRRQRELALDTEVINRRQLRASRLGKLRELLEGGAQGLPLIPDGAADDAVSAPSAMIEDVDEAAEAAAAAEADVLHKPRSCYACKGRFRTLHHFYSDLCPSCATLNFAKRTQSASLKGRVALLTGGRVKIGFQSGLKLLRCGATLIVTTRFPKDAALRYAKEIDSAEWSDRLRIVGLDFRDISAVSNFCEYLLRTLPALDMIVNNACQTIRRPPAYYRHLLDTEHRPASEMPHGAGALLLMPDGQAGAKAKIADGASAASSSSSSSSSSSFAGTEGGSSAAFAAVDPATLSSADQSQLVLNPGDDDASAASFPQGQTDVNAQQIDLRTHNSWLLKLEEVQIPELAEVFTINTFAPFIFNSKLKPLLTRSTFTPRYIINVRLELSSSSSSSRTHVQSFNACTHNSLSLSLSLSLSSITITGQRNGREVLPLQVGEPSAHEHGESSAEYDDPHLSAVVCPGRHPDERCRHGLDQR